PELPVPSQQRCESVVEIFLCLVQETDRKDMGQVGGLNRLGGTGGIEYVMSRRNKSSGERVGAVDLQAFRHALSAFDLQGVVPGAACRRVGHGNRAELRERTQGIDQRIRRAVTGVWHEVTDPCDNGGTA